MSLLLLFSGTGGGPPPVVIVSAPYHSSPSPIALIARPGWSDARMVDISPPSLAWRTDGPGSFDCEIETRALSTFGLSATAIDRALKGRWLWWEHPTAGPWGGVITRTEVGPWFSRVTAEQFAVLLRKRKTSLHANAMSIAPGSLALMYLTSAERSGDSFMLTGWQAEESGAAVTIEPRGGDLCDDIMPMLTGYGYQWRVRSDTMGERLFQFRTRLGEDKRGRVLLSEGRHIVSTRVTGDLWTVANSITGVRGDVAFEEVTGFVADDEASMRALARRYEETIAYAGHVTRGTIAPLLKRDLARKKYPQEIAEFTLVDADLCFADVREGDTISVMSQHCNFHGPLEIDIRSLDARSNTMTIAGRLLTEDV